MGRLSVVSVSSSFGRRSILSTLQRLVEEERRNKSKKTHGMKFIKIFMKKVLSLVVYFILRYIVQTLKINII